MTDRSLESFWWREVAGPSGFVTQIVNGLLEYRNVLIRLPDDLAWRHEMRNAFREAMETTPGLESLFLEVTDVSEDGRNLSPSDYVLERFVLASDRLRYRRARESVQSYLLDHGLLQNRVVWIKGVARGMAASWAEFISGWQPRSVTDGLFVVEDREETHARVPWVRELDFLPYSDETSVRLFCWSMLSGLSFRGLGSRWRKYAVALLANLCEGDVEVAAALAEGLDIRSDDPLDTVRAIATSSQFERRGVAGSSHVLALAREGRLSELRARVWAAQLETLFPLIENERVSVIESLDDALRERMETEEVRQFGKVIESPMDMELGTLVHLMGSGSANGGEPLVRDRERRGRILLLWRCRNLLAHRETCAPEQVAALLGGDDGSW